MIGGLIFIGLNIADAYVTGLVLAMGGVELNPLAVPFGAKMLTRGLLAGGIVALFYIAGRLSWLIPLNVIVFGVVLWNVYQYHVGLGRR